jgi:hypothetical protein
LREHTNAQATTSTKSSSVLTLKKDRSVSTNPPDTGSTALPACSSAAAAANLAKSPVGEATSISRFAFDRYFAEFCQQCINGGEVIAKPSPQARSGRLPR